MEVDLLDFVEQCRRLVKQALGKARGRAASGRFARWKHVVLHCLRLEDGHSYRETPNRLKYMAEIRDALGLDPDDLPDYSTIYKSFDRLKMWVWRALLRFRAAAPAVRTRCARQHVLRPATCVIVLSSAGRTNDTDAKSDDID